MTTRAFRRGARSTPTSTSWSVRRRTARRRWRRHGVTARTWRCSTSGRADISGLALAERLTRAASAPAVALTSTHDVADFGDRVALCAARGFVPKAALSGAALAAALARPWRRLRERR
jgi:hypothetical protein